MCWIVRNVCARDNWALPLGRILAKRVGAQLWVAYVLPPPPEGEEGEEAEGKEGDDGGPPPDPEEMNMTLRHGAHHYDGHDDDQAQSMGQSH